MTRPAGHDDAGGSARVRVRIAGDADVETLFDIRTSVRENHQSRTELAAIGVTPESIRGMLAGSARAWLVDVHDRPTAFAMADAALGTLFALFVRPDYEGRGVGRPLLATAEGWLFDTGWAEIWLLTGTAPALRAHRLYTPAGWRLVGAEEDGQVRYEKQREPSSGPG